MTISAFPTHRQIAEQRNTLVIQRRKEGLSLGQIAEEFKISRERVRQILNNTDAKLAKQLTRQITRQRTQNCPTAQRKVTIKNLLAQGVPLEDIQKTLDVSGIIFQRLLRLLKQDGVEIPGKRFYGILNFSKVKTLQDQGMTLEEIATKHNVSVANVKRILREKK